MDLIRNLFRRGAVAESEQGPLYPEVRDVMADVQAYARSHGGDIELVSVSAEGDVSIRMRGACRGCPMSALTIKHGIDEQLRRLVPGVRKVIEVK